MTENHYLVEIILPVPTLAADKQRPFYQEVLAESEDQARFRAIQEFTRRAMYEPCLRRQMFDQGYLHKIGFLERIPHVANAVAVKVE